MIDQIVDLVKHSDKLTLAFKECFSEQLIALLVIGVASIFLVTLLIHEHKSQETRTTTYHYRSHKY